MVRGWFLLALLSLPSLPAQVSPAALMEQGHFKRARAIVEERYRSNPNDAETLWQMSWVRQEWGDLNAAESFAEKAVAADPKNSRYHLRLADVVGEMAGRAGVLRQIGLGRRFKKEIDTTVSLDPRNIGALKYLMEYHLRAPSIIGGDKTKARAIPDQILRVDPVEGYFAQAQIARFDKQQSRIEELLRKAVEARPSSYEAHVSLGNYYASGNVKKYDEAESEAREAMRIDPSRVGCRSLLAALLARRDRWTELDAALAEAEKAVPDNLTPYLRAGGECFSRGVELARAEGYIRKYLTQEPEPNSASHAQAHWRLGLVLEKQGRKAEAITELQTSVKMDPNSPAKQDLKRLK
jgi:tetratricopeptide (TPR) repeat protein